MGLDTFAARTDKIELTEDDVAAFDRGRLEALAVYPGLIVCGDQGGNVYLLDVVGVEYGPVVARRV